MSERRMEALELEYVDVKDDGALVEIVQTHREDYDLNLNYEEAKRLRDWLTAWLETWRGDATTASTTSHTLNRRVRSVVCDRGGPERSLRGCVGSLSRRCRVMVVGDE